MRDHQVEDSWAARETRANDVAATLRVVLVARRGDVARAGWDVVADLGLALEGG